MQQRDLQSSGGMSVKPRQFGICGLWHRLVAAILKADECTLGPIVASPADQIDSHVSISLMYCLIHLFNGSAFQAIRSAIVAHSWLSLARLSPKYVKCVRRFTRQQAGASAVEFALLAAPFLALLVVVAEAGLIALEQQTLDIAVDRGARQLRTGVFQTSADGSDPSQRFRKIICGGPSVLFPCADLRLDVSTSTSASSSNPTEPFDRAKRTWTVSFGTRFDCPQGGDTITVRVAVPVIRLFPMLDFTNRIMSNKLQMLVVTEIFQAEDYEPKPC